MKNPKNLDFEKNDDFNKIPEDLKKIQKIYKQVKILNIQRIQIFENSNETEKFKKIKNLSKWAIVTLGWFKTWFHNAVFILC